MKTVGFILNTFSSHTTFNSVVNHHHQPAEKIVSSCKTPFFQFNRTNKINKYFTGSENNDLYGLCHARETLMYVLNKATNYLTKYTESLLKQTRNIIRKFLFIDLLQLLLIQGYV